jgi:hypothetical protein
MPAAKQWNVQILLTEDGRETRAEARLNNNAHMSAIRGVGKANRDPGDSDVPQIGDEIAAARALNDLARKLLRTAAVDIEGVTHEPAHLHT